MVSYILIVFVWQFNSPFICHTGLYFIWDDVDDGLNHVSDFGFAHYLQGETDTPYIRGTPLYMAPEIVIKKHYNEKADLWSVGVILYGKSSDLVLCTSRFIEAYFMKPCSLKECVWARLGLSWRNVESRFDLLWEMNRAELEKCLLILVEFVLEYSVIIDGLAWVGISFLIRRYTDKFYYEMRD